MINISDPNRILDPGQIQLLHNCAAQSFTLGKYTSFENILTSLKVDVIIEPGIEKHQVPSALDDAENFWNDEVNRLENELPEDESKIDDYNKAKANVKKIKNEKSELSEMLLRGLYDPINNSIKLYPEEMMQEYNGQRMDELLVSTLAHETMHAYFNRDDVRKTYPYVIFVEEPLAEFGMLLYMHTIYGAQSVKYNWAYDDVKNKKTCYRYGATLMRKHLSRDKSVRKYLEKYKIGFSDYPVTDDNSGTITLPKGGRQRNSPIQVGGQKIVPQWHKVFKYPPRYFYDETTKTLGLDGDWSDGQISNESEGLRHFSIDKRLWIEGRVDYLYLGDNFTIREREPLYGLFNEFSCRVIKVSQYNKHYCIKNGVVFYDNTPILKDVEYGFYLRP